MLLVLPEQTGVPHPLDPNFIDFGLGREHYIYGDVNCNTQAQVDYEDYLWFCQWAWCPKTCRAGKSYLRRAVAVWEDRRLVKTVSLYLHVEIMKRTGIEPPTPEFRKVDHRDGDTWNCRRGNLRWATDSMNRKNIRGSHAGELFD